MDRYNYCKNIFKTLIWEFYYFVDPVFWFSTRSVQPVGDLHCQCIVQSVSGICPQTQHAQSFWLIIWVLLVWGLVWVHWLILSSVECCWNGHPHSLSDVTVQMDQIFMIHYVSFFVDVFVVFIPESSGHVLFLRVKRRQEAAPNCALMTVTMCCFSPYVFLFAGLGSIMRCAPRHDCCVYV